MKRRGTRTAEDEFDGPFWESKFWISTKERNVPQSVARFLQSNKFRPADSKDFRKDIDKAAAKFVLMISKF
jgi:hypothetical protein